MVFCGKPSKGCGQCRSRKIRCDQARPACSQCIKANRECPGYRDELSLMFRDESQQVARKAKTGSSGSKGSSSKDITRTAARRSPQSETSSMTDGEVIDFNIDPQYDLGQQIFSNPFGVRPSSDPTEFEAICFFLRCNTWPGAYWTEPGKYPSLFVTSGSASQRVLEASIAASGSAMLSRINKSQPLKLAAEKHYSNALSLMASTLSDGVEARANSTLAAVLIMTLFEVITSRAPKDIVNWTNHIHGAATLLQLRGVEQLQTEEGLGLFLQLRFQIIISCLQRGAYVPESVLECSRISMFLRPQKESYGDRLVRIMGRLSNLRADINSGTISKPADVLSAAYSIEGELVAWLAGLPPTFSYYTVSSDLLESTFKEKCRGILPYNNKYHVYRTFWVCNAWNQYRTARILTNEIILGYLKGIFNAKSEGSMASNFQTQLDTIRNTIRELAIEICSSVPYHFGAGGIDGTEGWSPPPESYIGGYVLLWPLFLAGMTEKEGHPMRKWAADCLTVVGRSMGVDQALALVDIMGMENYFEETDPGNEPVLGSGCETAA